MRAVIVVVATSVLLIGLAGGCASRNAGAVPVGQSEAEVLTRLGPPTGRYSMPDGASRLEYATGPAGRVTWMVDLDAAGKVTAYTQVLVDANFAQVRSGMTRDQLLPLLGRPSKVSRERGDRETLSWRYDNVACLWFQVTLTAAGYVMGPGRYQADSECKGGL